MKLEKDGKEIMICDICLEEKLIYQISPGPSIQRCRECNNINPYIGFNSVKRLKWYILLYEYQKEGYELMEYQI